ncbi:MAG: tetratricopeptide repeat protein [Candidatus Obscuribacterales bacterium]|nr:tetratricopeptide repeat protein [Candidatus Obscuribacterales bacterium]
MKAASITTLLLSLPFLFCAPIGANAEGQEHSTKTAMAGSNTLTGSAVSSPQAVRLLGSAEKALDLRLYAEAKITYDKVQKEVYRGFHDPRVQCLIKMGQAEVVLKANEDANSAIQTLTGCTESCRTLFGEQSPEMARLQLVLSEAYLNKRKLDKAASACNQALEIHKKLDPEGHGTGVALSLSGRIEAARGLHKEAQEYYLKALKILEALPGQDMLDYANTLYASGLARLANGDDTGGSAAIEKARSMLDSAVSLNKTPDRKGIVHYQWADGVPECRQIYDTTYPLKYMVVDNLRIAVALVRSDEHLAAIVSLANCSKEPLQVAVGPVVIEKTSPGDPSKMFYCDPGLIDLPLEEECVSNLTWRRRWLCHIQKTHRIPGYLKSGALDPDNFYGNNVFGVYGCWDGSLQNAPPVVTREQFFYEMERKSPNYNEVERFMARSTGGFKPALIEPGDARTGVVFFLRQRYDTARVRVMIGNAIVDFPFQAVAGR